MKTNTLKYEGKTLVGNPDELKDLGVTDEVITSLQQINDQKAVNSARKMAGVEFQGVMCSATGEDQAGLHAFIGEYRHYQMAKEVLLPAKLAKAPDAEKPAIQAMIDGLEFPQINLSFENGNKLVVTEDNIEALEATWKPFRMSFFPVPEAA